MMQIEVFHLIFKMNFLNRNLVYKKMSLKLFKNRKKILKFKNKLLNRKIKIFKKKKSINNNLK